MEGRDCCANTQCCEGPCDQAYCEKKCSEKLPSSTTAIMGHIKARHIEIDQLDFGYTIRVGCQSFAIQNLSTLICMLDDYLKFPEEVENKWRTGALEF